MYVGHIQHVPNWHDLRAKPQSVKFCIDSKGLVGHWEVIKIVKTVKVGIRLIWNRCGVTQSYVFHTGRRMTVKSGVHRERQVHMDGRAVSRALGICMQKISVLLNVRGVQRATSHCLTRPLARMTARCFNSVWIE